MTPFLSFFWNLGRVENIRHRVDTTTKRQETTAITWEHFFLSFFCAFLNFFSPLRRRNDADSQTSSTNVSVSWSSSRCQNPPLALLAVTSEKWHLKTETNLQNTAQSKFNLTPIKNKIDGAFKLLIKFCVASFINQNG